jgi:hypothetical protein
MYMQWQRTLYVILDGIVSFSVVTLIGHLKDVNQIPQNNPDDLCMHILARHSLRPQPHPPLSQFFHKLLTVD